MLMVRAPDLPLDHAECATWSLSGPKELALLLMAISIGCGSELIIVGVK